MRIRNLLLTSAGIATVASSVWAFQRPFREYPGIEYNNFPLPDDYRQPAEFAFARLMYPPAPTARFDRAGSYWAQGMSSWTQDYPRADRHLAQALRRLTRIDTRSVEQPVNLDDGDEVYNWPWIYAVRTGEWSLTDAQARITSSCSRWAGDIRHSGQETPRLSRSGRIPDGGRFLGKLRMGRVHAQHAPRLPGPAAGGRR